MCLHSKCNSYTANAVLKKSLQYLHRQCSTYTVTAVLTQSLQYLHSHCSTQALQLLSLTVTLPVTGTGQTDSPLAEPEVEEKLTGS